MSRLKRESRQMTDDLVALQRSINITIMKKFGMLVDLDELENGVMNKLWFQGKIDDHHIRKRYAVEDAAIQVRLSHMYYAR